MTEPSMERGNWGKSIEFLMSCIAMNVGLGNIWRFPFVAFENGGGAFLIPYLIVLILMGRPMYYLEMCLGQFCSRGNVKVFESLAPILKGIGFGQMISTLAVSTYYCSLMALTLYYLVNSFTNDLPWAKCNPEWAKQEWLQNTTCIPSNGEVKGLHNSSISSAEAYFRIEVLNEKIDISDGIGYPSWRLTICLFISWLVTFAVCAKGVKSSGKASYFLALFPFIILIVLLVRAVTLEGAGIGILYFVQPNWHRLLDAKVWYNAVTQCFFSLNIGSGSVTMYASYNRFTHNVYRDAMIVATLDTCTSFLAGTIIFGILGNLAHKMKVDVPDVISSGGTGLAFISYPEAIARMDMVPWLFAILFFFMLFILGTGCLVALISCVNTVILDSFPHLRTWHVALSTAFLGFIIGLVYITPGGQYVFTMVDFFGATFIYFTLTIFETLSIMWWYGLDNICQDIEFMLRRTPGVYWRLCWGLLTPAILLSVFLYFVITIEELKYEEHSYPVDVIVWGWLLFVVAVLQPLIWWLVDIGKNYKKEGLNKAVQKSFSHAAWGPQDATVYQEWLQFKKSRQEKSRNHRNWLVEKLCMLVAK